MATKPTEQPEIWASADFYSSGPKAGQPTKATSEAGIAIEGHKPGPTEPTTSNEFNVFENKLSLLARWTFEGRFDKSADAHPVETDSGGLLSARACDFGDPLQPGPSMTLVNSATNWMALWETTSKDGFRLEGIFTPGSTKRLMLAISNLDNAGEQAVIEVIGTANPSCTGIRIQTNAGGTISGENLMAGLDVLNTGGTGLQVRTSGTILPAARFINTDPGGTSARFGHGNLEVGDKNLDGTAIDCRGGDADGGSLQSTAGSGILTQGGEFTTTGTPKSAGHGIVALSGLTSVAIPGGAAVFAQTVGPRGIAVYASHNSSDASLPVFQATTGVNTATAYKAVVTGAGNGLDIEGQSGAGLLIGMTPDGSGDVAANIKLIALGQLPAGTITAGEIWPQQMLGRLYMRAGIGLSTPGYMRLSKQPTCYARSAKISAFILNGSETDEEIAASFTWSTDMLPAAGGKVRVTIWGWVDAESDGDNSFTLAVRDTTAVGSPKICEIEIRNPNVSVSAQFKWSATFADVYTLPAAGARNFDLVWSGTIGASVAFFTGWVEIQEIPGD